MVGLSKIINTPIGELLCIANDNGIEYLVFRDMISNYSNKNREFSERCHNTAKGSNIHTDLLESELKQYFNGELREFTVNLSINCGSDFARLVWQALLGIGYSKVISYKEQSKLIGRDKAYRAVANANGLNPLVILVPCHRVVASDGKIGGYSGGVYRKEFLLNLESVK